MAAHLYRTFHFLPPRYPPTLFVFIFHELVNSDPFQQRPAQHHNIWIITCDFSREQQYKNKKGTARDAESRNNNWNYEFCEKVRVLPLSSPTSKFSTRICVKIFHKRFVKYLQDDDHKKSWNRYSIHISELLHESRWTGGCSTSLLDTVNHPSGNHCVIA